MDHTTWACWKYAFEMYSRRETDQSERSSGGARECSERLVLTWLLTICFYSGPHPSCFRYLRHAQNVILKIFKHLICEHNLLLLFDKLVIIVCVNRLFIRMLSKLYVLCAKNIVFGYYTEFLNHDIVLKYNLNFKLFSFEIPFWIWLHYVTIN